MKDRVIFYRRMPPFDYVQPHSFNEALEMLDDAEPGQFRVFAGGTDILEQLKTRKVAAPQAVVDLKAIPELRGIEQTEDGGVRIGATASVASCGISPLLTGPNIAMVQQAKEIASRQIQNRATIVGNICNAVPSADSAPPLLALDAKVICVSARGERSVGIESFFLGPGRTVLEPNEIVREIRLPTQPANRRSLYVKLAPRGKMDLAWVGVGVSLEMSDGVIDDIRIAMGAVAPTPIRALKAEAALRGQALVPALLAEAAQIAATEIVPRADSVRASTDYRRETVRVLVERAVNQLAV